MARGPDKRPRKSAPYTRERRIALGAVERHCLVCGAEFWVSRSQMKIKGRGKFCSLPCKRKGSVAHKQRRAAEVTRHTAGYLLQWAPDHPRASRGRVLQHILVAETKLGRSLRDGEEVHHINGRRDDNRAENIEVVKSGVHQSLHWKQPEFRAAQSERSKRQIVQRKRDARDRLLPE